MKKIGVTILILFASFKMFSLSDIGISFSPYLLYSERVYKEKIYYDNTFKLFSLGLSNYNFLGKEKHFGFYEKISYSRDNDISFDLSLGGAFGLDINSWLRVQAAPSLNVYYTQNNSNNDYTPESQSDWFNISFGFAGDFQFKFLQDKIVSPVVGCDVSFNPLCYCGVISDSNFYYASLDSYELARLRPYVGITWNLGNR